MVCAEVNHGHGNRRLINFCLSGLSACLSASVIGRKHDNKCGIPQKRATGSDCRIPDSDEKHSDKLP